MLFRCTQCGKRCRKIGESSTTFGDPPTPDHVCYECETHGYHVLNVEHNAIYGESGRPDGNLEHIRSVMGVQWGWFRL